MGKTFSSILTAILLVFSSAQAKLLQVTSDEDPATLLPGTLRYVIQNASNGDTIQFASDISYITLEQGEIKIDKDLSIQGSGVTLNGNNSTRLIKLYGNKKLLIDSLMLMNGYVVEDSLGGGAILNFKKQPDAEKLHPLRESLRKWRWYGRRNLQLLRHCQFQQLYLHGQLCSRRRSGSFFFCRLSENP